jgi:hypothetical protein
VKAALTCVGLAGAGLAALHPRAAVAAVVVSLCVALVAPKKIAAGLCLLLLVAGTAGLRVDAAPPSPSARSGPAR